MVDTESEESVNFLLFEWRCWNWKRKKIGSSWRADWSNSYVQHVLGTWIANCAILDWGLGRDDDWHFRLFTDRKGKYQIVTIVMSPFTKERWVGDSSTQWAEMKRSDKLTFLISQIPHVLTLSWVTCYYSSNRMLHPQYTLRLEGKKRLS